MNTVWAARGAVILALAAACSAPRDLVPETRDVRVATAPRADRASPYVFVARRARCAIGLAGAKNVTEEDARRYVEGLASELDACARKLEEAGSLVTGAARFVAAALAAHGPAVVSDLEVSPGSAVAANALLCVVAPVRASTLPRAPRDAGPEDAPAALLLEATWAPVGFGNALETPSPATPRGDGGSPK